MKITNTQDTQLTRVKSLVFGDSGIGKTTSLRTLPTDGTVIAIGERGALPLRELNYQAVIFDDWNDVRQLAGWYLAPDRIEDEATQTMVTGTKQLAIDGLSEMSAMCCRHIIQVDRKRMLKDRSKGARDTPPGIYEEQMTMDDWGLYRTRMNSMASVFSHLPIHLVCTCLAAWSKDKVGNETFRTPALSGKAAFEVPAFFDEVFFMTSQGEGEANERVWQTFHDGRIIAKDASGILDRFEPPNWTDVLKKILKPANGGN